MISTMVNTLQTISRIGDRVANDNASLKDSDLDLVTSHGSITKLLSTFIIEPTIVISNDLKSDPVTEKVISANVNMFTSFYLQAFHILVSQYELHPSLAFDVLSSNTSKASNTVKTLKDTFAAFESNDLDILPIGLESLDFVAGLESGSHSSRYETSDKIKTKISDMDQSLIYLKEVEVSFNIKDRTVVMPVTIKANIVYTDFSNIQTLVDAEGDDKSFGARLDKYRAGLISASDLVFGNDLIEDYRNERFKDDNQLLGQLETRRADALSKVHSGTIGYNLYYNMLIVTEDEKEILETLVRGELKKDRYKEKLLEQSKSIGVTVVDTSYEMIEIFIKDLKGSTEVSFKNIKKASEKDDMTEIFKALIANKPLF